MIPSVEFCGTHRALNPVLLGDDDDHQAEMCGLNIIRAVSVCVMCDSAASERRSDRRNHRHRHPGAHHLLFTGARHALLLEKQEQIRGGGDSQRDQVQHNQMIHNNHALYQRAICRNIFKQKSTIVYSKTLPMTFTGLEKPILKF